MKRNEFDEFVDNLQQEIIQKEIEDFNERIVELFQNPPNWGKPNSKDITVSSSYRGPCGDLMQFYLKIEDNKIKKINFVTDGCGASVAAGAQLTLLAEGRSIKDARKLAPKDIDVTLNNLPEDHKHCALLAIRSLNQALDNYEK